MDWNFGVWGWKGFLAMHGQVSENTKPDPLLSTSLSEAEKRAIEEFSRERAKVLGGARFADTSAPWKALLTRISAWVNADVAALKAVQVPAENVREAAFTDPKNKRWIEYLRGLSLWRVPVAGQPPKDADVAPVFTVDEEGSKEAHVFLYYQGSWRFLFNTGNYGIWQTEGRDTVKNKLEYLRGKPAMPGN